jgi:8-oxo-dGTP pyrophosphatase MutT (NUDIX family)
MAPEHVAPKVAGVALIAADTGRVLMLQRAHDDPKDPAAGTWEFPGGHLEPADQSSVHGGIREWEEEVGRRMPKGTHVAGSWTSPDGVYAGHVLTVPSEDHVNLAGRRVVDNPDDDSEQRAWWKIEHARRNPALRPEVRRTPWNDLSRIAREAQMRGQTKDVYAAMAPATYTRGLGSGVGRSPVVIESHAPPPLALAARKLRRRRPSRKAAVPGENGSVGPFPSEYGRRHRYARDVHSGAGNCVCGRDPGHRLHVGGAKALADGLARIETKDPEVLEIYRGARAETKVRHVRTASGVRRYHAPIGTPIIGNHAVGVPSAGGGRTRAGRNAGRGTSGLLGGNSRRGSLGGQGGFTGRSRRGLGKRMARRAVPGGRGGGFNGPNGVPGGGGLGGVGGLFGGAAIGKLFGSGKKPPKAKQPPKQKKPKQAQPPKAKKGSSTRGSGVGKGHTGKGAPSKPKTTPSTSTSKPTQGQLDQAAQQLIRLPPDRLTGVLHTMPYGNLGPLLSTIQDPEFANRVAARRAGGGANAPVPSRGAKSLAFGAAWLVETKDDDDAAESCPSCGDHVDDDYFDTLPSGKGYELVVCPPCATESKAGRGSGDSGVPGHLPEQLRRYWTTGKGKAQWAASPHPYTALVNALSEEEIPRRMIHGLAANLFKDVFGIYPANRPRALGGSTHGYAR